MAGGIVMRNERTRIIVEVALVIALAAILNLMKIWRMPQGGTVSFVLLPLIVLSLRRGLAVGLLAGTLYGIVDFLIDPFPPVHWAQYLLDYPVAYGLVGLSGLFAPAWRRAVRAGAALKASWSVVLPATLVAVVGRYAAHFASGVVFFGEYAPEGQPVWLYSALYNSYVPVAGVLAFVAAIAVLPVLENAFPAQRTAEA
jgi:thiamine transporter